MRRVEDDDHFHVLKGWDLGDAAQVRCPKCEARFFTEGKAYKGEADTECPSCGHGERIDYKAKESPQLTF